jgi:hypothetical protein
MDFGDFRQPLRVKALEETQAGSGRPVERLTGCLMEWSWMGNDMYERTV